MGAFDGHPQKAALKPLAADAYWPDLGHVRAWDYTLGGQGRHLVDALIRDLAPSPVMLEIGCFLCASTRRWLELRDDIVVVGIDPWDASLVEQCQRYVGRPALTRAYPDPEDQQQFARDIAAQGPYATALANIPEPKHRFIPVRGRSPDALGPLADAGLMPDLIYIDANKDAETLDVCHRLWPGAQLSGDDWHWGRTKGYPMRQIVRAFAEKHSFSVEADHATWVLHPKD